MVVTVQSGGEIETGWKTENLSRQLLSKRNKTYLNDHSSYVERRFCGVAPERQTSRLLPRPDASRRGGQTK